jgi:hypothetical protein
VQVQGHGAITTTTDLFTRACPSSTPVPPTQLPKRICGAPTSAKSARRATSPSPSPLVRQACQGWGAGTATHGNGGTPLGNPTSPGLRDLSRGARKAQKARRSSAGALLNTQAQYNPYRPRGLADLHQTL